MRKVLTTCGYCGCGCNFYLNVENDEIVGVTPKNNHSVSQGKLCVKGWQGYSFVHHRDRLKQPLIRKEDGEFYEVTWEAAMDYISSKLKEIIEKYGSDAISILSSARCTNEENYLIVKLARAILGTNNIDHCARLCHSPTVAGLVKAFGSGAMTNSINEIEDSEVIFVIGSNTTEQHPLIGMRIINAVKKNGAKLIVADPRKIPLTEYSTIYAPISPGSNLAFINGVLNVIINENLMNEEFIKNHTEGFEEFKSSVEKYTPEVVAPIAGVSEDTIREIARLYAKAKTASIFYAMGITQHITGTRNVGAIANLALLAGQIGKESSGVNPLRGQNNVQGSCDMGALPDVLPGYQALNNPSVREKFAKYWGEGFASEIGKSLVEMMDGAFNGDIKTMFVMAENPMLSDPNLNHAKKALEKLELLVVQDIFMSETAKLAHVVLPGASFIEKDGTFTNTERLVQRVRKALEPIGNSKADWEILCELIKALGYEANYSSPSDIMEEIRSLVPSYGGITYERIEKEGLQWPCPDINHPGTKFLHKDKFTRGLGKFTVNEYEQSSQQPSEEYPFILTTGRIQYHYHTGTMTRRSWALDREYPGGFMEINPEDAEKLKLRDGGKVKVSSKTGDITIEISITDKITPGVVFIPFHFAEAAVNKLIGDQHDPVVQIPEFKVCAVKLEGVK
ncbi:formate dehydrogenase H [Clostridium homopropionicum DSM 5847]|uniref:Formate dehydrogenase H n=1 Tax=Clostridium homopropionicum DSM 5847 TaxID=1121318 RepID=A0A0L6ZCM1_9CLOT|nr:formate dehydrogenase subunit alpha [Clostridium homopropionicum]KOA20687.1 formate dehydrogenase H [Clostridium homopropionicum DSM 5847]SFF91466.1 NAD-dependent formate dehydrogenase catalytic subunit [Clostridium homopropionicum]